MNPLIPKNDGPQQLLPHAIKPMHIRHAEDSAFYWMQRDGSAGSPLLRFERLAHFDQLLNAHLDGLREAGEPGWEIALKNLTRWSAALALHLQGEGAAVATDMWQALQHLNLTANNAKGLARKKGFERCIDYARHFGHALPVNHFDLAQVAQMLPPRQVLTLFAHHGDPVTIPLIAPFLTHPLHARLAGWALSMITGINLDAQNLIQAPPEPDENEDELARPGDPDGGLPWPSQPAISAWWNANHSNYQAGQRLLAGQSINDKAHCLAVLGYGTQAERYAAALNLALADQQFPFIETRAMAEQQQRLLNQI